MTDVLVCIKRVPDFSGEVLLTEDAQAADARFVGYTLSNHDSCAVELAIQVATATGGAATVLSVGGQGDLTGRVGNPLDADQDVDPRRRDSVGARGAHRIRSLAGSRSGVASTEPTVTGYSSSM